MKRGAWSVFYDESLASLFRPSPKNLLIGLGLVNLINLSEFKAILAHEFGHFRQSSMKLGTYVYQVNGLIGDIVFARGALDAWSAGLRHSNNGQAMAVGWGIYLVLSSFRLVVEGFFFAINFLNLSLSRQMEFNADLTAVSVSGSDPIITGLLRAGFGDLALMYAFQELTAAADHKLYSWDLFVHQGSAAAYLRRLVKDPNLGERPPALPADATVMVQVFNRDDAGGQPSMWATHPPNFERERNAKEDYIWCATDERSPWLLFDKPDELRERVTWNFYRVVVKLKRDVSGWRTFPETAFLFPCRPGGLRRPGRGLAGDQRGLWQRSARAFRRRAFATRPRHASAASPGLRVGEVLPRQTSQALPRCRGHQ